jgi:zinc protease
MLTAGYIRQDILLPRYFESLYHYNNNSHNMRHLRYLLTILVMLPALFVNAQGDKIPFDAKVKRGQLPNGLRYFIIQNKKPEKKIELRMVVNAGSILEDNDQLGLAHLMEHMNFNGLEHFPHNEVVHYLQSIGVDFGADLNAYTSFDETVYILPIPADDKKKIDQGFQVIADWSHAATLDKDEIDKERGVVLEESRLGKGADDRMMKKWLPEYMNGSMYGERLPIGKDETLKTFPHDVLRRFYKDWYRPDLEAVMVVGDIEPAEAERLIREKFSGFANPASPRTRPASFDVPMRKTSKAMVLSDKEAPYTMVRIIGNSRKEAQPTTLGEWNDEMKKGLFNTMFSNRLDELRNAPNPPFVFAFGGYSGGWARGFNNFQLFAICGTDKIEAATDAVVMEARKAKQFGFTGSELDRAKASLLASYEKQYNERDKTESRNRVDELVRHFTTGEPVPGIEWEYNWAKSNLPGITLSDVNALKEKLIDLDQDYFALVTTKSGDKLPTDADLKGYVDKSLAAPVQAYTEKALPKSLLSAAPKPGKIIKEEKDARIGTTIWTLSNGAKVTFKKTDFKNDEILFSGYRHGGSSLYTGSDFQSADYCNNVVDEMGYGQFSNTDLSKFMTGKIARVSAMMDLNGEYVSGSSSIKDLETAMQLLYLKCTDPRTDASAFTSFKDKQRQMLAQMKSDPDSYFSDSLNNYRYGNNPRMKEIPDPRDYEAIQLPNAVSYYKERFSSANGMNYFFVGSIPEDKFKTLVETYIGSLGDKAVEAKTRDLHIEPLNGQHDFTLRAGTEQKSMVTDIGFFNTPYTQNDELALNILSEVINNRIIDTIREKMSAIYGGGVGLRLQKYPKERFTMQSWLPCGPENSQKVRFAFWDIVASVKKQGNIQPAEISKAVETSIQKYRVNMKTNNYWLSTLSKYQQYGLPTENINNLEDRLHTVTPDVLTSAANKYLSSDNVIHALMIPTAGQ